jgi:hypothetical protein
LKLPTNSSFSGDGPASTFATRSSVTLQLMVLVFFRAIVMFTEPGLEAVALICLIVCVNSHRPSAVGRTNTRVVAVGAVLVVGPQLPLSDVV